ncbi:Flp pilus assembly complex ATPase component TadA [Candidatus Parcubacteria bacterium]|nr:Flp pilus assembly complex ATPase component TadA [Patescibacteria group bacterium]MBU4466918.1 Flp pilus assembly complex ATPase component TadA [Patescibacteria group bacterium]MCG2688479.1 Flp pilus assembly complex ATPase component TadA [Candidatus Parcubacteria bacterium]
MTLIQRLLAKGIIDREKASLFETEVKEKNLKEEEVILESGVIGEKDLFKLKSQELKIPLKEILPEEVSLRVLEFIPEESARYYKIIPLGKEDGILDVGMVYPEDLANQEALNFISRQGKWKSRVFLITLSNFDMFLKQYKTLKKEVEKALSQLERDLEDEKIKPGGMPSVAEFERLAEEAPITKVVAVILGHGVDGRASDIHIEPTGTNLRVRYRLDGILHSSIFLPLRLLPAIISRIKILSALKIDETRMPQDGRFSARFNNKSVDFRVATFPTVLGEKVAIRILDSNQGLKSLDDLGLTGRNLELIKITIAKPYGLILVTGPTGSGKTTTLYTVLRMLNKEGKNIVTLEDPVEYFIDGINQSQVKSEIGYDFASGLRHILRQAPDIIMVGEIRDEETANLTTHAALTGHLVLATLHTNNSLGVIPRLVDLGVKPFLIPPTLEIAIAQRLVRKLCQDCKKKVEPDNQTKEIILQSLASLPEARRKEINLSKFEIFEPQGCKKCNSSGFSERIAVFEVLEMTKELAEIVLHEPSEAKIAEEAFRQGMITMKQDGILKALEGITTIQEVIRVAEEK